MHGTSELLLIDYKVEKIHFDLNPQFECMDEVIKLHPKFTRTLKKQSEKQFIIHLGVKIDNPNKSLPFACEIVTSGKFELTQWEEKEKEFYVLNNTCAILFPYLRNVLFTVTMNANVPPYTLPIMNVVSLFQDEQFKS